MRRQQGGQHELITLKQFNRKNALNFSFHLQPSYNKCSDYALKRKKK